MKILRYSEYDNIIKMSEEFIDAIGSGTINESEETDRVINKTIKDLKLNASMVLSLGTGIQGMIPVVNNLIKNSSLKIDMTIEAVVLMSISAITIAYLEEVKEEAQKKIMEKDAKSMLEELKLKGVGNGIIKKLVSCIKAIGNIFKILFKNKRHVINGVFDMFAYTSIVIPFLNGISYMINKYEINIDTLVSNFVSLGLGVTTIIAKHGINYLINKLKDKLGLNKDDILKNINDIDDPLLKKYPHPEIVDIEPELGNSKLIKEQ